MSQINLLDQMRNVIRVKHYSIRTEDTSINWMKRSILFHKKRYPSEMRDREMSKFLTHLAVHEHVSAATQNQALHAIL